MSTRSSAKNHFPPLDNPELTIQRRSRVDPTLLSDFKMANEGNGDPSVPGLRTIEELCQPTLNGRGGPIAPIAIQATNFGLKNDMIQQFDRLPRNSINTFEQMAKMFLGKYFPPFIVTKLRNEITNFHQRPDESLFEAWERYKLLIDRCPNRNMLPVTQIDTLYNGLTLRHRDTINAAEGGTFMKRRPKECYDLIKNMTAHHNDWDTSSQQNELSSYITSSSDSKIVALKAKMAEINKNLMKPSLAKLRTYMLREPIKVVILTNLEETVICLAIVQKIISDHQGSIKIKTETIQIGTSRTKTGIKETIILRGTIKEETNSSKELVMVQTRLQLIKHQLFKPRTNMTSLKNSKLELKNMFGQFIKMNTASSSGLRTLPSNTVTNPKEDLKGITTRSGNAYQRPTIPTTSSPPKVVEHETEVTKDTVPPTNNRSTKDVQPLVVQIETLIPNSEPVVAPVLKLVVAPVSAPKPNQKPLIPYPSRLHDQKLRDKANDQKEKFFKIFQDLNFNISFANALILMLKLGPTIKSLLTNKDKLFEVARTLLNEHCLAVLLKKLPEKLGDPGKFLIPCDFSRMDECLALADLSVSINLMPLSVWNKLSLPERTPTLMTLELADRSISRPIGVAEDVFVKVGKFHFPTDFVVVDFDADPRVPLIIWRSFLKTGRALIDVYA
nr:reverse transcriptase domain-containing protein [Tanacetum cinerariifolium]